MFYSHSPVVSCSACGPADDHVCGIRDDGRWCCVLCGEPAVNLASPLAIVTHSLRLWAARTLFEVRLRGLSRFAIVRALSRR